MRPKLTKPSHEPTAINPINTHLVQITLQYVTTRVSTGCANKTKHQQLHFLRELSVSESLTAKMSILSHCSELKKIEEILQSGVMHSFPSSVAITENPEVLLTTARVIY